MEENIVRTLEISAEGLSAKAAFFVEYGVLHASIDGRIFRLPIGPSSSEETVRRLLVGNMQTQAWRDRMAARWHRAPWQNHSNVIDLPTIATTAARSDREPA